MTALVMAETTGPRRAGPSLARLALLRDFREEGWPSMDLCAEMLSSRLRDQHAQEFAVVETCAPFQRRCQRLPVLGKRRAAFNADRLLNRLWDYPRYARQGLAGFDAFHVVDHSYAHLVHALPAERTGVYCHDLDTFRCLLEPGQERRPRWFRAMVRRILDGLQRAAIVFHSTSAVRAAIERYSLIEPTRLVHAPLGHAPEFCAEPAADPAGAALLQQWGGVPYVLHVGSCIPRKRIDVLLRVVAALRSVMPNLRLVKVGGSWSAEQEALLAQPQLHGGVVHLKELARSTLATLYRHASLVLVPSEAEGFGLPVIEALACGTRVLASDLPVLREVGGAAVDYAPVGDVAAWLGRATAILGEPDVGRPMRTAQAACYSWRHHAHVIADAYRDLLS